MHAVNSLDWVAEVDMDAFACIESRPNSNLQPDVDTFACIESRPNSNL
jgi:hypothetical protein